MVSVPISTHVRDFEREMREVDFWQGRTRGDGYATWLKQEAPDVNKMDGAVHKTHKAAVAAFDGWREGTGVLRRIRNWGFKREKTPADQPYKFKVLTENEKKDLESKCSGHKTAAKVLMYVGAFFILASVLAPFALLPVFLAAGKATTAITTMCLVSGGVLGTALAITSVFIGNSEAIRRQRALTDPDFSFFIDKVVQNPKGYNFNISENDLVDKELHQTFVTWKDSMEKLFTEKKREKLRNEFQKINTRI